MLSSISIKYKSLLNQSIWLIDETLTGTTTQGQRESNDNDRVFHSP